MGRIGALTRGRRGRSVDGNDGTTRASHRRPLGVLRVPGGFLRGRDRIRTAYLLPEGAQPEPHQVRRTIAKGPQTRQAGPTPKIPAAHSATRSLAHEPAKAG